MKEDYMKRGEKIIVNYIRKNPCATYREIRKETKLHPERIFKSLGEAFGKAKIPLPRTFIQRNKEERKKIISDYIKKHPGVGGHNIAKETKINVSSTFKNIKDAYESSGLEYPRRVDKRKRESKKREILDLVRKNPLISIQEIAKITKTKPYNFFKDMEEIYLKSNVKRIRREEKWRLKKQKEVLNFIKKNKLATQREINNKCKTHVQSLFPRGIFEAYEKAEVNFPFERLKIYGIGLKRVRESAKSFEKEIAIKLSGYGKVNRLVKTKRGFADIILERKGRKVIIEIKDYKNKEISFSQVKQLNGYLEDCGCKLGFIVCHKKPKKDKFLIGKNKIFVIEKEELKKLPRIIDGSVV